ncbi:MAG: anaerobic ribonucleoside-triphosphate reductase activating protein [Bacteroidales bacterium]
MLIGGFIPQSFIDYPGKMAAVVFTAGCNFRCWYCHNPELVLPELMRKSELITRESVVAYLYERKGWIDGVVITGGEPTLHANLPEFIQTIKSLGYLVKLDTNGSNPGMLSKIMVNKLIDYVAMDIKNILEPEPYNRIIGVKQPGKVIEKVKTSVEIIKQSGIDYEFRTTKVPGIHTMEVIRQIQESLGQINRFTTNDYRNENTLIRISDANKM